MAINSPVQLGLIDERKLSFLLAEVFRAVSFLACLVVRKHWRCFRGRFLALVATARK